MFWLSHHHADQLHRCFVFAGVRVCARCLGTYPTLALVLGLQFVVKAPLHHPSDLFLGVGLLLPATLDWAYGQLRPDAFSNAWRAATGVLLGMALGRSLYIHLQQPLPPVLLAQAGVVTMVAVPVILMAYNRSRGR